MRTPLIHARGIRDATSMPRTYGRLHSFWLCHKIVLAKTLI